MTADDLDAGLHQLVADDETDVARADHQDLVARLDAIDVHQRLRGSRPEDARHVVVPEHQHLLGRAGCDDDLAGMKEDRVVLVGSTDSALEPAERSEAAVDGDVGHSRHLLDQFLGDGDAARPGVLLRRAEELVGLFDQLATQLGVLVQQDDVRTGLGCPERCFQTCWPATDDQDFGILLLDALHGCLHVGKLAVAVLRLDFHPVPDLQDAGTRIGDAVDAHHAG